MFGRFGCLQIFQSQFQLLNLLVELLGTAAELHPFQLQDVELQRFDFVTTLVQCRTLVFDRGVLLDHQGVLFNQESFQCIRIERGEVWKVCCNWRHALQIAMVFGQLRSFF